MLGLFTSGRLLLIVPVTSQRYASVGQERETLPWGVRSD